MLVLSVVIIVVFTSRCSFANWRVFCASFEELLVCEAPMACRIGLNNNNNNNKQTNKQVNK